MIDHPGPLHHVVAGTPHPSGADGTPHPPAAEGTPHPPGPVPGPPVGERSRSGGGAGSVVHSPRPARERVPPAGHSPSSSRAGSGVAEGRVVLVHGFTQ